MGSIIGKQMDENMKKQQQFMLESQRLQLERQLQMQNLMRERMMASQVAQKRDLLKWIGTFTVTYSVMAIIGFRQNKNKMIFAPLLPLTFVCSYLADMAYGSKLHRIRKTAEILLHNQPQLFSMPLGNINFDEIERRRNMELADDELKPNDLFL